MSGPAFARNRATAQQLAAHLQACDADFLPPLGTRVDIAAYAAKIATHAERHEAWADGELAGLVAVYCNDPAGRTAFITSVSVLPRWRGRGIGARLLEGCLQDLAGRGFARAELEVQAGSPAAALYGRLGFASVGPQGPMLEMILSLKEAQVEPARDYDAEIRDTADHRYAYNFDFDVMHPFMLRSFEPFLRPGSVLELGSFQGDFTRRLLARFADVTCVEASEAALAEARRRLAERVQFVQGRFEDVRLPRRYDNIVLTHVLEHLDDPVRVLRRINEEWLADGGRLFLVCPNANAPSRQIAVRMGLISHNAAVTPAEAEHGHRCTYTLDTLERDAVAGGLEVRHRSGIFFKALANFQWDRLLQTDIVSREYLEGCYKLGQVYPDLCASIFLLCEKGSARA